VSEGEPDAPAPRPADGLSKRHRKTLEAIFQRPTRSDIRFDAIENLFRALGAEVGQGRGSRVRVLLNGEAAVFHEPHPERVACKGLVESVRAYLENAGVEP
jgi:hypothetical protein